MGSTAAGRLGDPAARTPVPPPVAASGRLPAALIVCGPPGSGKTTLGTALAARLGYAIADLDAVTGRLTSAALALAGADTGDLESPVAAGLRGARYETLIELACANLAVGIGVVLCGPFTAERRTAAVWDPLAARLRDAAGPGAGAALLYLELEQQLRLERLAARAALRDRAKLQRGPAAPELETLVADAIVLDGTAPLAAQVGAALEAVARQPAPAIAMRPRPRSEC